MASTSLSELATLHENAGMHVWALDALVELASIVKPKEKEWPALCLRIVHQAVMVGEETIGSHFGAMLVRDQPLSALAPKGRLLLRESGDAPRKLMEAQAGIQIRWMLHRCVWHRRRRRLATMIHRCWRAARLRHAIDSKTVYIAAYGENLEVWGE
jgi:hypothetical protein